MDLMSRVGSFKYLEKGLEAASIRHSVISNNLANAETPKFKKSVVTFENELKEAMLKERVRKNLKLTNERHLPTSISIPDPKIVTIKNTNLRNDLNNVDIDQEMALLAKNTIMFQALSEQISRRFNSMKSVITGG